MKVLYILRYYPTLTETFVNNEIAGAQAAGVQVAIASLGEREDGRIQDELPSVPLFPVPRKALRGLFGPDSAGERWLAEQQRPRDAARLPDLAEIAADFDHLHVHFAGEAAEFAHALHMDSGVSYSVTVHATDLFRPRPSLDAVLAGASAVIAISRHAAALLRARLRAVGAEAVPVHVVRCGPDATVWAPLPLPGPSLRALFVGRPVAKKGLDVLLEAWARLDRPDARLELVTDLPESVRLPAGVQSLGFLPPREVRAAMTRANAFVLPCRPAPDGDLDGVPVAMMEAMAMGRPVLTTPISGIPELVADDPDDPRTGDCAVGWLVPPDDTSALVEALRAAADQPSERALRGEAAPDRLWERRFSLADQVRGVLAAWGLG